ncbi:GDSL esterase/lipase At3g48460-like [Salvia miltiorrhiza]|uniref:GDSL esterase/lipase At3g48460-like n=1 Tax=Salvia miltiorrhiza TaxID=226208 RepID=UPI0025AB9595|nr:GDSL esterase/lipase At3g48460-like [Salvia miltiorrhiza]
MPTPKILFPILTSQMSLITLIIFFLLLSSSHASSSPSRPPFKRIYAFGDSYTDTGNTKTSTGPTAFNYVSNPPYGVTFFHHPTNRYSDGRIVLDFVAEALSLPFVPPYRNPRADRSHGVNFAVAGATAIRHGFFSKHNITFNLVPQSLQTQLAWFDKILESEGCKDSHTTPRECEAVLGDALIWVGEIGANDYTSSLGSSLSRKTIQALAINSVAGFLQAIMNKGAKYIVVQGLPSIGCITYSFSLAAGDDDRDATGCVATVNRLTWAHNAALEARLTALRKRNPNSVILYADYYNAHLELLRNAAAYGFKERYKACCGYGGGAYNFDFFNVCGTPSATSCADPSSYINWDGAHFTEEVYKLMARSFLNGSHCSPPFHYLIARKVQSSA